MTSRETKVFAVSALFAAMLPVMNANASIQIPSDSAAGLGRAFAGQGAVADDASVIATNPAAMSLIDSMTVTFAGTKSFNDSRIQGTATGNGGPLSADAKDYVQDTFLPAAYLVMPVNERITIGAGVNRDFGINNSFGTDTNLSEFGSKTRIVNTNIMGSVAYQWNDSLSFGFGVNVTQSDANIQSIYSRTHGNGSAGDNYSSYRGDNYAFGWNAGVLWEVIEGTRLGVSYRSEMKNELDGFHSSSVNNGFPRPQWNRKADMDFDLPAVLDVSLYHQLTNTVALHASAVRTFWSSIDEINYELSNDRDVPATELDWDDAMRYSVGATWNASDKLKLRAGITYSESQVDDKSRTFRSANTDQMWYTIGANYMINKHNDIDFGYAYIDGDSGKIDQSMSVRNDDFHAEAKVKKSSSHIVSLQYNYRF